ncbi:hypothetical protein A2Z00_05605 [Candidatus Gottesmanbacteria bacterium RBG_13_45_10]|uniref:Uncharacterized protein n=1 Tax=Candidatus Gottesmanbacteria bacterium RBG_13_45_10 TaxID=1798370 RepID=A0A1F5ZG63_9BACT|nr:MAG: hypothetical protein A2Z00_05605 [Candidatus Gottesmanbacteria bacterium RBG_13_45_10]
MTAETSLDSQDLVIVLAQALTGLGHLRVSHALYHGLPTGTHALLLTSQDTNINYMHRMTSINPWLRSFMEFAQGGWAENITTVLARDYFRRNPKTLEDQLRTILEQHITKPKTLLVVATHVNLAHQLASVKDAFAKKYKVRVVLVVVVTDDSPQHIWAVGGADLIFVPSEYTKRELEAYHRSQKRLPPSKYVVLPYMVSPNLGTELPDVQTTRRKQELDPTRLASIHVAIPISGAAVQLTYFEKLISDLRESSDRFVFHIVSQQSPATASFLSHMIGHHEIKLLVSISHREVVELYESLYEHEVIALEVTKPSEQSFKALLKPRQRGGCILLLSDPVGRQEWDNIRFLVRHSLLPTPSEQQQLWNLAQRGKKPGELLLMRAKVWRAVRLPSNPTASAQFIWWCFEQRIFFSMVRFAGFGQSIELSSHGVDMFWDAISLYLKGK